MQGFYRNHMEEVIRFFETHHKVRNGLYLKDEIDFMQQENLVNFLMESCACH